MSTILICDDEKGIRDIIKKYAIFENFEVIEAENGMQAVEISKEKNIDIIVMDVMMPELDGFSAVKEIKKNKDIPVIMLTARSEEYDKIIGFEIGVDDYVSKPFSPKEITLRINAILKRYNKNSATINTSNCYEKDGLKIDMIAYKVFVDGEVVNMTLKEYELLFYLVKNKNIAISRDKLMMEIWGYEYYGDERTLDTHIKILRKSLKNYAEHIKTIRGLGYRFDD